MTAGIVTMTAGMIFDEVMGQDLKDNLPRLSCKIHNMCLSYVLMLRDTYLSISSVALIIMIIINNNDKC